MADRSLDCLRRLGQEKLRQAGIPSACLDWDLMAMKVLGKDRAWIHSHGGCKISPEDTETLNLMVSRRALREPLHYITGSCPFWGMDFAVSGACLVPRPETELLVEGALEDFKGGLMADWGTGSGCIAGAVLSERPGALGIAVDSSPRALEAAYRNLKSYGILDRCLLWHCFDPFCIPADPCTLDLIISNPPYIRTGDIPGLMAEVSLYEPRNALDGGADGLDCYRVLLPWASETLKIGGSLWVEFGGSSQVEALKAMAPEGLRLKDIREDLSGNPCVMAWSRV